jgi:hypothetical protein
MTPETIIVHVVAGGLLGMLGQGVRVIPGMKKAHDEAAAQNKALKDVFELNRMLISFLIGFIAGALALLTASSSTANYTLDNAGLTAIVAAGYAGTDFIEAFMKKYLPASAQQGAATPQSLPVNTHDEQPPVG